MAPLSSDGYSFAISADTVMDEACRAAIGPVGRAGAQSLHCLFRREGKATMIERYLGDKTPHSGLSTSISVARSRRRRRGHLDDRAGLRRCRISIWGS
jgi:hypothetical protein